MQTMNPAKAEELFHRIRQLSERIKLLGGVVQNPDFVTATNVYEHYQIFEQQLQQSIAELSAIKGSVGALCKELDPDPSHTYGLGPR